MNGDIGKIPSGAVYPATPESLATTTPISDYSNTLNGVTDSLETYVQTSTSPGGSLADPNSGSDAGIPLDQLKQMLSSQLEYYFSRENLANDAYLLSQMDNDQYVPIWTVANFNQVKKLTKDIKLITEVLRESPNVQVDEEGVKVRPNHKRCIVILREIPDNTPLEEVKGLFVGEGCPRLISCEFAHNNSWYVTFESDEDAQKAYRFLREEVREFQGKPIMARIKAKPMNRLPTIPPASAMGAAMKNGYRTPPTAIYDPNTYQNQQRFLYSNGNSIPPNVTYGNQVQIYAFQHQQPFYPPSMLQPWAPTGPGFVELGSVFSFNGLAPQTSFGKPQGARTYNPRNRNKRNQPLGDRSSIPDVMNLSRHSTNAHSYHHHLGGMGSTIAGTQAGNGTTLLKNMSNLSGSTSSVGKTQITASGVVNDNHHNHSKSLHQPSTPDVDQSITPSQTVAGSSMRSDSDDYRQPRDALASKEPMPPRHRRRRKEDELVNSGRTSIAGKSVSGGSPQPVNRETIGPNNRGAHFDLEATAFPPLPGMDNGISVATKSMVPVETVSIDTSNSHWENRLSDVVKGTAKVKYQISTSPKEKEGNCGIGSGSPRAVTPTSPVPKPVTTEKTSVLQLQHLSSNQSNPPSVVQHSSLQQLPSTSPQILQQQQPSLPHMPSSTTVVHLPLPLPQNVPQMSTHHPQTSHSAYPVLATNIPVAEKETKEVGTGNKVTIGSTLTPPSSPDKTVPVATKLMADKSTKTDDTLLSSDYIGGGQCLSSKTGDVNSMKHSLPTTSNVVTSASKPVPTTTNAATMTCAVVVSDMTAPSRTTAVTCITNTLPSSVICPAITTSSLTSVETTMVNSVSNTVASNTASSSIASSPVVAATTAVSTVISAVSVSTVAASSTIQHDNTTGATARLSYAQVAQHHKEKVERLLREKQTEQQEKDREKDRKKEAGVARIQQHNDRDTTQRDYREGQTSRFMGMGRGRPVPAYDRQDRGTGVRRRDGPEKVPRYRDNIHPRSPK